MTIVEANAGRTEKKPSLAAGLFVSLQAVSPPLAAYLGRKLFFAPPHPPLRPDEAEILRGAARIALGRGDRRALAYVFGEGSETVFLVHGWGGHAGHMAAFVAPLLAGGRQVVALDLPGHGAAGGRTSSLVHGADALAVAASRFGPVGGVIAHSFGAGAAVLASHRGLDLGRAVFVAPPARFDPFWARFRAGLAMTDPVWERLVDASERWLGAGFAALQPVGLASSVSAPVLVLHGTRDKEIPSEHGAELARALPAGEFEAVPDGGHLRILKDAAVVRRAAGFLTG